jgi:hypothetical protein
MSHWTDRWSDYWAAVDDGLDRRRVKGKPNKPGKKLPLHRLPDAPPIGFYRSGGILYSNDVPLKLPKRQRAGANPRRGRRDGDPIRRMGLDPSLLSSDE